MSMKHFPRSSPQVTSTKLRAFDPVLLAWFQSRNFRWTDKLNGTSVDIRGPPSVDWADRRCLALGR